MKNIQETRQKELVDEPQKGGDVVERDEKGRFVVGHTKLGGREVGSRNFVTDFDEAVQEIAEANKIKQSEARKILLKKAYAEAKNGNFPFYKDIMDRYYGKEQSEGNNIQLNQLIIKANEILDDDTA